MRIAGGEFSIESGDDALYSNLEASIDGGTISLIASDDGFNAAGGQDNSQATDRKEADTFQTDSDSYIKTTGGTITIDAAGDGIDSNGSLSVTGGEIYASGPTMSGNGALDYNGDAIISGGFSLQPEV